jgi:hypothetical protein
MRSPGADLRNSDLWHWDRDRNRGRWPVKVEQMRLFLIFSAIFGRKYVLFWAVLFCLLLASMLQMSR